MALRLRRGTDAERQLITPLEGELIYTTDTKILYIGDGVTQGGLQVTGAFPELLNDLSDVDTQTTPPTEGQVLKWNGSTWIPQDQFGSGEQLNIDIIADDSTVLVDSFTRNFQGNTFAGNSFIGSFIGDGSQLTNLPIATDGSGVIEGSNYRINIVGDDSSILVNTATKDIVGNFFGDGSGLGNLNISTNSIFDLSDVFANTPPDFDDVLTYDGANFVPRKVRFIYGNDSTVMVNTIKNEFIGNFIGDGSQLTNLPDSGVIEGSNYRINIVGDDSSLIVDSSTNTLSGNIFANEIAYSDELNVDNVISGTDGKINLNNTGAAQYLKFRRTDSGTASNQILGLIGFDQIDDTGIKSYSSMAFWHSGIYIANSSTGTFDPTKYVSIEDGKLCVGGFSPETGYQLDVNGNGLFRGEVVASAFKGTVVSDDSTIIIDGINGSITTPSYVQFGSFTTTDRNLLSAANGMVIYNTTDNRFQGYQNGSWINLDDGSIA